MSNQLFIYNTLTRKKEAFKPLVEGRVGLYVCGPTVYSNSHLGHARPFITFDLLFRYLTFLGNKVRYVRNITDVGHLEDEVEGVGEHRIANTWLLEQQEPMEVDQKYMNRFQRHMYDLKVTSPSIDTCACVQVLGQSQDIEDIPTNEIS